MTENSKTFLYKKAKAVANLSDRDIDKLFTIAKIKYPGKGEIILREGQICRKIIFVEKGYLRTFYNKDGKEVNTDFTFEGNFTTHLKSLRTNAPSDIAIQTGEPTTLYELDKDQLLGLYQVSTEIESFGRKLLEQLLIHQEEHINLLTLYSPAERYQYLRLNKPELLQRISLSQLASYLGVARETLSRIRKKK